MDFREKILSDIARLECERIGKTVVHKLQRRKDRVTYREGHYCFMSREHTGLETIWDEICVQVSEAHYSAYWDYFKIIVNDYIGAELVKLSEPVINAIWLQTDEAEQNRENYERGEEEVNPFSDDLIEYIADEFVYQEARKWSNKRIEKYKDDELYSDYTEFQSIFD